MTRGGPMPHDAGLPGPLQQRDPIRVFSEASEQSPHWAYTPRGTSPRGKRLRKLRARQREASEQAVRLIERVMAEQCTPPWETLQ